MGMLEAKETSPGHVVSVKRRIKGHGHLDIAAALENAVWADHEQHGPLALPRHQPGFSSPRALRTRFGGDGTGFAAGGFTSTVSAASSFGSGVTTPAAAVPAEGTGDGGERPENVIWVEDD
jgi:hypothetical protein